MRWEVLLDVNVLEATFRSTIYKFIKHVIATNPVLYEEYYAKKKISRKPFSFAPILPPKEKRFEEGDRIVPLAPLKLYVSTNSPDFAQVFEKFLDQQLYLSHFEPIVIETPWLDSPVLFKVLKVKELSAVPKEVDGIKVRCPSLVINHHRYPTIEAFFDKLSVYFEPTRTPKRYKTKHRIKDAGVKYLTYDLEGRLYAKNKQGYINLRTLLSTGLGWKKSQGFGFIFLQQESRKKKVELRHEQKPIIEIK